MICTILSFFSFIAGLSGVAQCAEQFCTNPKVTESQMTVPPPKERTFIMIKPDGVQRGLVGEIIKRFERRGFKLVAMKMMQASKEHLQEHYSDLSSRTFFNGLVAYMASGPVVPMVWEGFDVVKTGRAMLGETNPVDSRPGTIRGDYAVQVGRNIIHGSDSVESAKKEIKLWFKDEELNSWMQITDEWINTAN